MKMSPTNLIWRTKNPKGNNSMVLCSPYANSYFQNWKIIKTFTKKLRWLFDENIYITHKNNFKWLTQWAFTPLGKKLIYTTENLPTLTAKTNCINLVILTWSQSITWLIHVESHNQNPCHKLLQTCLRLEVWMLLLKYWFQLITFEI